VLDLFNGVEFFSLQYTFLAIENPVTDGHIRVLLADHKVRVPKHIWSFEYVVNQGRSCQG
jgi:hypothetical protein